MLPAIGDSLREENRRGTDEPAWDGVEIDFRHQRFREVEGQP